MFTSRVLLAIVLGVVCAAVTVGNAALLVRFMRYRKRASQVPLVGGLFGAMALLVFPDARVARWAWLPPLLDPGCVPLLVITAIRWIRSPLRKDSGPDGQA